ncbi:MAG: hypothetical protein KF773_03265 [Deltaproteobacteria bacterium]|nr:hypothetical protein [Deltaproteobacteria bacterium]
MPRPPKAPDFRSFLAPPEPRVLPYFGGTRVDDRDRWFHLADDTDLAPGWWRFQIAGRRASPQGTAEPTDLTALPALRGHHVDGWVVGPSSGKTRDLGRIALPPDDEPAPLAPVTARRWPSGEWLFDSLEFEDEAEEAARRALEERRPLAGDIRGASASLRAAYGYALGIAVATELNLRVSIPELTRYVVDIANDGPEVVRIMYERILEAREVEARAARVRLEDLERARAVAEVTRGARALPRSRHPRERADAALAGAGARMLACVSLHGGDLLDVTYAVDGVRVISTVDPVSLQVIDPGVCLAGAHRVLTLDAMPSVIREAREEDHLNITRR